jgi:glyceraldehyde 3-phosphate dehydrogenase
MVVKVAINGYGRIGRNILRAVYESQHLEKIRIVAINDLSQKEICAHLTKHDTTHGLFSKSVHLEGDYLIIDGDRIALFSEKDPELLPWGELDMDVVFECTGLFTSKEKSSKHLSAGAKKVIISAPASGVDATIVYGVNHQILSSKHTIISNASCTTNCLAPLVKPLHDAIGVERGLMTSIHPYTSDQCLIDASHSDLRKARSATQSIIPTKTGAAVAVGLVFPELDGLLDGLAIRIPTTNVSIVDFTFEAKREASVAEVNHILYEASVNELKNVLAYNEDPLVSIDFNHNPHSAIFDSTQTIVVGKTIKVLGWYDNEWGFSNRMLDTTIAWMSA